MGGTSSPNGITIELMNDSRSCDDNLICSMCVSLSPAVLQDVSPDDGAQGEITAGLSEFAGSFKADGRK